jgi:hypothetical protein
MLEHVALHQSRFKCPGIALDARGVALGKQAALLVSSVDALIGWFRVLSDELPLDDLLPTLAIHEVRGALGGREYLVVFQAASSHLCDRAARIVRFLGGLAFTGSGKHFVAYRDDEAPLGYDIDALAPDEGDYVLYAGSFTQAYVRLREVPFRQLVFQLALRPVPGETRTPGLGMVVADGGGGGERVLWLTAPLGLARNLLGYLHRSRVTAQATMVERDERSAFGSPSGARRRVLVRAADLPPRMLALLRSVPGIAVFRPVADNVVVEVGYRHPLRLESCQSVFSRDRFYLFTSGDAGVEVIGAPSRLEREGALAMSAVDRFITVGFGLDERRPEVAAESAPPPELRVALRLVPASSGRAVGRPRAKAVLVGWERAAWLKRLVFLLPPSLLRGSQLAALDEGLLVVADEGVDALPIGDALWEAAPSVYVPVGWELLPRVPPEILGEQLGGTLGRRVVIRRGAARPLVVEDSAFAPLSRRLLGQLEVDLAAPSEHAPSPSRAVEATVVNDPVGPLPLWGYRAPRP